MSNIQDAKSKIVRLETQMSQAARILAEFILAKSENSRSDALSLIEQVSKDHHSATVLEMAKNLILDDGPFAPFVGIKE